MVKQKHRIRTTIFCRSGFSHDFLASLNTIAEVPEINKNIIVIATKLQKRKKTDIFTHWSQCEDMQNIQHAVYAQISPTIPVLPLKSSGVFDAIFEQEKSISHLIKTS